MTPVYSRKHQRCQHAKSVMHKHKMIGEESRPTEPFAESPLQRPDTEPDEHSGAESFSLFQPRSRSRAPSTRPGSTRRPALVLQPPASRKKQKEQEGCLAPQPQFEYHQRRNFKETAPFERTQQFLTANLLTCVFVCKSAYDNLTMLTCQDDMFKLIELCSDCCF